MSQLLDTSEAQGRSARDHIDPELEALPKPRRPGRRITLGAMALTLLLSLAMAFALRFEVRYAMRGGPPADQGDLTTAHPTDSLTNTWVRGEALLGTNGAIRYSRPLDRDSFRLAPVAGNDRIWVEVRVPSGHEGPHFVPPSSFVGRFIPMRHAGLRHSGLKAEVSAVGKREIPADAWLLVDGESPTGIRWVLGLVVLFAGFALFNLYGLYRLLRPVRDD
jgi:hypothetical protein